MVVSERQDTHGTQAQDTSMARQNFLGYVVSQGKMNKTIKVRILQNKFDKKVQKEFMKKKDYLVHDEANICREGDLVRIEQTRPLSSRKFFAVAEIKRNKGQQFATYQKEAKINVTKEEIEKAKLLENKSLNQLNLYKDIEKINLIKNKSDSLSSDEISKIEEIKLKYNITNWNFQTTDIIENRELFQTSMKQINNKIENLSIDLKISNLLNDLLNDESKSNIVEQINTKMGIAADAKKNVKKNIIRKFIKNASSDELKQLGLSL